MVYLSENLERYQYFTINEYNVLRDKLQFIHLEGAFRGVF